MTALRLGSLFDGIGVFPLAAVRCGIEPVWASEIEKAPISITKRHFPDMAHLGDVTKLDGREIPPVHIITFGSPCQNLSQIGNRKGLAGEKSSLFFQAIRIMAALPQQGAAPLAPLRGYPCTPTNTVHPPLASVPFLRVLLSYPGGDTHSHLPLEHRHCEPRKRQISRCRSRLPKR